MTVYLGNRAIYNGIEFRNVLTEDVQMQVQKDSTGTDPIFINVAVTFKGIVHTLTTDSYLGPEGLDASEPGGGSYGDYMTGYARGSESEPRLSKAMQHVLTLLNQPRRNFQYFLGEDLWFNISPILAESDEERGSGSGLDEQDEGEGGAAGDDEHTPSTLNGKDVNKGPTTKVHVHKVISANSVRMRVTVNFSVVACDGQITKSPSEVYAGYEGKVLHMRYWIADDLNGTNWLTTRTYQGRLRVASQHVSPHAIRLALLPPLMRGFRRRQISWNESPDGLELDFRVVDEQVANHAPYPASDWSGFHMVSTPFMSGAVMDETVFVRLTAPAVFDKITLLNLATRIMDAKLDYLDKYNDGSVVLMNATYKDDLKDNTVEAMARVKVIGKAAGGESLYNVPSFRFGLPLNLAVGPGIPKPYQPDVSHFEKPIAGSVADVFTCELQNPCAPAVMKSASEVTRIVEAIGQGSGGNPRQTTQSDPIKQENLYSEPHRKAVYADYRIDSDYFTDEGKVWLPLADLGGDDSEENDQSNPEPPGNESTDRDNIVVQLYKPQCIREIRIEGERLNEWPVLPDRVSWTDANGIRHDLLDYKILGQGNELSADGLKTIYRIGIQMRYIMSRAPKPSEDVITTGILPYRTTQSAKPFKVTRAAFISPKELLEGISEPGEGTA